MIDAMGNLRELNVKGCHHHTTRWQPNLHRLRITKTEAESESDTKDALCSWTSSFSHMEKLELLDLSGHTAMQVFPDLSKASNLKTVIVDGCTGLESINTDSGSIPESLEAFSLDAAEARTAAKGTAAKVAKISLSGCSRLSSLLLRGLANLEELDLSGTAVKTLDLNAMEAPQLRRLLLLRCQRLCAILFSSDGWTRLSEVQIGTTEAPLNTVGADVDGFFESHVGVTDARLLRSLELFARRTHHLLLCMSSTAPPDDSNSGDPAASKYSDIVDRVAALQVPWPRPRPLPPRPRKRQGSCKVEIRSSSDLHGRDGRLASFVDIADSLYVHDGSWSRCIPGSNWGWVKWCSVERCPRLVSVFDLGDDDHRMVFCWLETFWASDLRSARFIWGSRSISGSSAITLHQNSFGLLRHIHLHSCPRLIHVLPLSSNLHLPTLEEMEILYCESLRHVFPPAGGGGGGGGGERAIDFPGLKHIHLHELPRLQGICEGRLVRAPVLEAVEIKGCWSLRRLPAVAVERERRCMVDCEKEWWERLEWEWDAWEDGHDALLYDPRCSRSYKRALRRGSLLR